MLEFAKRKGQGLECANKGHYFNAHLNHFFCPDECPCEIS